MEVVILMRKVCLSWGGEGEAGCRAESGGEVFTSRLTDLSGPVSFSLIFLVAMLVWLWKPFCRFSCCVGGEQWEPALGEWLGDHCLAFWRCCETLVKQSPTTPPEPKQTLVKGGSHLKTTKMSIIAATGGAKVLSWELIFLLSTIFFCVLSSKLLEILSSSF